MRGRFFFFLISTIVMLGGSHGLAWGQASPSGALLQSHSSPTGLAPGTVVRLGWSSNTPQSLRLVGALPEGQTSQALEDSSNLELRVNSRLEYRLAPSGSGVSASQARVLWDVASSQHFVDFQLEPSQIWPGDSFTIRWSSQGSSTGRLPARVWWPDPQGGMQQRAIDLKEGSGEIKVKNYASPEGLPISIWLQVGSQVIERRLSFHRWNFHFFQREDSPKTLEQIHDLVLIEEPGIPPEVFFLDQDKKILSFSPDPQQQTLKLKTHSLSPPCEDYGNFLKFKHHLILWCYKPNSPNDFVRVVKSWPPTSPPESLPHFPPLPLEPRRQQGFFIFQERLYLIGENEYDAYSVPLQAKPGEALAWSKEPLLTPEILPLRNMSFITLGDVLYGFSPFGKPELWRFKALPQAPHTAWLLGSLQAPQRLSWKEVTDRQEHISFTTVEGILVGFRSGAAHLAYSLQENWFRSFQVPNFISESKGWGLFHQHHLWYLATKDKKIEVRTLPVSSVTWRDSHALTLREQFVNGCSHCAEQLFEIDLGSPTRKLSGSPIIGRNAGYQLSVEADPATPSLFRVRLLYSTREAFELLWPVLEGQREQFRLGMSFDQTQWRVYPHTRYSRVPQPLLLEEKMR